ncbi:MAG: response regulator [Rickettsiales bacterium]
MIIIDEYANEKLNDELERLRDSDDSSPRDLTRYVYFNLLDNPNIGDIGDIVTEAANKHIFSLSTKIYLCDDRDIFILTPSLPVKDLRNFIMEVANSINIPVENSWVEIMDISTHINHLLVVMESKLEKRRKIIEDEKKIKEERKQERIKKFKHDNILNVEISQSSDDIRKCRRQRDNIEIMIIEDDVFSRRLVENVLQKKYSLTGLGEASHALSTYAKLAPDLLFLDINLPDVTGHELLEKIMRMDPHAYTIMLSGNCDKENVTQAMKLGAKGFIAKPFTRDKLMHYIDICVENKNKEKSRENS